MSANIIQVQKWRSAELPTEAELAQRLRDEGMEPLHWSNLPGDVYPAHQHDYHKVIYVVSGSITFGFPIVGEPTELEAGDRLDLPAGIKHNAAVGSLGVVCLEGHQN